MSTSKKERKKQNKALVKAEREAALRRRRRARLLALLAGVAALVGLALFASGDDEGGRPGDEQSPARAEAACDAETPPEASPDQYEQEPEMALEPNVDYAAEIVTSCGTITIDLLEKRTPITVNNFVFLAREGYYDGLIWHRVERNSVIQTGDPNGLNGVDPDGPGYAIRDELPDKAREYIYGVVGMANAGPNSGGSQFFIVVHKDEPAGFQPLYSIFGKVDPSSYEVIEEISKQPTDIGNEDPAEAVKPINPIYIESIEITES